MTVYTYLLFVYQKALETSIKCYFVRLKLKDEYFAYLQLLDKKRNELKVFKIKFVYLNVSLLLNVNCHCSVTIALVKG